MLIEVSTIDIFIVNSRIYFICHYCCQLLSRGEFNIKAKRAHDPLLMMTAHMEQTEKYHKQSKPDDTVRIFIMW